MSEDKKNIENPDESDDSAKSKAKWQIDKINEANNQIGKQNGDEKEPKGSEAKAAEAKDTRKDSILSRPKTETYEKDQGDNVGDLIKRENYTHADEEKKRDEANRKNRSNVSRKSEHSY